MTLDQESRHLSVVIDRSAAEVYDYAVRPQNLPLWAAGLASGVSEEDGRWYAESPMGRVELRFAPGNEFGVLDHHVIAPDGETTYNPMRVIAADEGAEVMFTLRRRGRIAAQFKADVEAVQADLLSLRRVLTG